MANEDSKRLFFGFDVIAPWPHLPKGRHIEEENRHMTLHFLGNVSIQPLWNHLKDIPSPPFILSPNGISKEWLFLPHKSERVVALSVHWYLDQAINTYWHTMKIWLNSLGYPTSGISLLPHVTLARKPFEKITWINLKAHFPLSATGFHLYESQGALHYKKLWSHSFIPSYKPISHTADLAFIIRGTTLEEIFENAITALSFEFPSLLNFVAKNCFHSLDDVIVAINRAIGAADTELGSPFKAVSYSGALSQKNVTFYEWEMIVDV